MESNKTMLNEFYETMKSINSNYIEFQKKQRETFNGFSEKIKNYPCDLKIDETSAPQDKIMTGAMLFLIGITSATAEGMNALNSFLGSESEKAECTDDVCPN